MPLYSESVNYRLRLLQAIALAKMDGHGHEDIAARLGCAPRTVQCKLAASALSGPERCRHERPPVQPTRHPAPRTGGPH
jgi:hypothetical protein